MSNIIDALKAVVAFVALALFMVGWGPSIGAWFWFLFHNWVLFGGNGWLVAQLLAWAVINFLWFIVAGYFILFGLMDEFTSKTTVFGVLAAALIAGCGTVILLIHVYGW